MVYFPHTVKTMRDALAGFPDDMPLVSLWTDGTPEVGGLVDADSSVELIYIDSKGVIVGTDAEDYEPKVGERAALVIW